MPFIDLSHSKRLIGTTKILKMNHSNTSITFQFDQHRVFGVWLQYQASSARGCLVSSEVQNYLQKSRFLTLAKVSRDRTFLQYRSICWKVCALIEMANFRS